MDNDRSQRSIQVPAFIGAALGAIFYFVVAVGVLRTLLGDGGLLVSQIASNDDAHAAQSHGFWIGRVMSDPINLITFIAFGAALAILLDRQRALELEQRGFEISPFSGTDDSLLVPEDGIELRRMLRKLGDVERRLVVARIAGAGLQRARANWSAEDVSVAVKSQADIIRDEVDAEYSTVRYLAWAIPSIGFIGTVLGIGAAIGSMQGSAGPEADNAGNQLSAAASHLHTAFDTTFVSLVLSLVLMYVLHQVQAADDSFIARATEWTLQRLPFRMHIPKAEALT